MDPKPLYKKKVLFRALTSALGYYIFGYSLGAFTSSQDCISSILNWGSNKEFLIVLISSFVPLGAFVGSIVTGFMSKYYGERRNIMFTDCLMAFASLIVLYPNTVTLCISRFLSGLCAGAFSILCSQYTSKYTPKKIRGKLGALNQAFVLSGLCSAYSVCIPLPVDNCRSEDGLIVFSIFVFPGLVALIQFLLFFKVFKKETPIFIMRHGGEEQAKEAIESVYRFESVQQHFDSLLKDNQMILEKASKESYRDIICCVKSVRRPMRICAMFHMFSQLTGINAILAFTTRMIIDFGEGVLMARVFTSCITFSRIIFVLLILPLLDQYGRKSISIQGQFSMSLVMLGITLFIMFDFTPLVKVLFLAAYLILFSVSTGPVVWIYTSEVAPDKGVALCTSLNWLAGFVVVILVPVMIDAVELYSPFAVFSFVNLLGAVYLCFDMIETKGLSRHEIIEKFSK